MSSKWVNARGLSILGAIICVLVLLLTGVSCSGANDMAPVSKGVSTTYTVSGYVACDENNDFSWFNDGDHFQTGFYVWYQIEGSSTTFVRTDQYGRFAIERGDNVYVDIWLWPESYAPHWLTYYEDIGGTGDYESPNPTIRVPANTNEFVGFVGSDYSE